MVGADLGVIICSIACPCFAVPQSPLGTVSKKALYTPSREDEIAMVGDVIEYIVVASNDGNVDLVSVSLADQTFKNNTGVMAAG